MHEVINSVGIDIGTSTTQLIFSKLTIENLATSYTVPRICIVDTEVVYRSKIYFTPLLDSRTINAEGIKKIVKFEYEKAGMKPEDLKTGAVIITGETARKENANDVLSALSEMAGDFVVATAGPDLESVLAAKGAGTDMVSKDRRNIAANIDIGGGTSNIAVFNRGELVGTSCLDIGGRLVRIENGRIAYIYEKISELAEYSGIDLKVGQPADEKKLKRLADVMAEQLAMAIGLKKRDGFHNRLYTNEGKPLPETLIPDGVTFSGGVAVIAYEETEGDKYKYGDVGVLLGDSVRTGGYFDSIKIYPAVETIRATVVGAGTHTTEVSGSTIRYEEDMLPLKNVVVVKMTEEEEDNLAYFSESLLKKLDIYTNRNIDECVAIGMSGNNFKTFDRVQELAKAIIGGIKNYNNPAVPILIIVESDIGKVLGNALKVLFEGKRKVICIDNIFVKDGDFIDIGRPVAGGRVVPVVTKTLIFNS